MDRLFLVACTIVFQLYYAYKTEEKAVQDYHTRILAHQKEATSEQSLVVQAFNMYLIQFLLFT